jgi:hypothetical protein
MTPAAPTPSMSFWEELRVQRWDDHRYYHQSRVNQSLHLFSALCFLVTYALIPFHPAAAAFLGWIVAMWSRQVGHFFFEPSDFDRVNNLSFERKEEIKVGFNLQRKVILLVAWVAVPLALWQFPDLGGLLSAPASREVLLDRIGSAWIGLAGLGLLARTGWLIATRGAQTGLVWLTKILTDPVNDVRTYYKSPYYLLKGQWIDPMDHVAAHLTSTSA